MSSLKSKLVLATSTLLLSLSSLPSMAAVVLNELLINAGNPSSGTDQDQEFIEIRSTTGGAESLSGLWFIYIEGDAPGSGEGFVDFALDLSSYSTGSNGLLLLSDGNSAWDPAADAATTIVQTEFTNQDAGGDDLENGSATFAIVSNYTGGVGADLDSNNDGTLDSTPWDSVVSVFGWKEFGTNTEKTYAVEMGGIEFDANDLGEGVDAFALDANGAYALSVFDNDTDGNADGDYFIDAGAIDADGNLVTTNLAYTLTPGSANLTVAAVPLPAAGWFMLSALSLLAGVRKKAA